MILRVGTVTNVYSNGKVKVFYGNTNNTSVPLHMLTMNKEFSMPKVGDRVVTAHMTNGSSKGFVLGTYYGGRTLPSADSGYRKDLDDSTYVTCEDGKYVLHAKDITVEADDITLKCSYGEITVEDLLTRLETIEEILNINQTGG